MAKKWLFWLCEGSVLLVGAMPNVPLAGENKIVFKKCGWRRNKKHRDDKGCRITRCPLVVSFLCLWSPVKMVCFLLVYSRLFVVVVKSFTLTANLYISETNFRIYTYYLVNWRSFVSYYCFLKIYSIPPTHNTTKSGTQFQSISKNNLKRFFTRNNSNFYSSLVDAPC